MTYCNPGPIAIGCYLKQNVVENGLKAIFNALYDLISIGKNICIKTGFCNINFIDKNLTYSYSSEIFNMVNDLKSSEDKFKWGVTPVKIFGKKILIKNGVKVIWEVCLKNLILHL